MHSYSKLWTHVVFSTKDRVPLITPGLEPRLCTHIHDHFIEQGCVLSIANGMPDHIHLLFLQNPAKSLADVIKNVKGSSSYWVNQNDFINEKFSWQTGYAAFSVSESQVKRVHDYITNQKEHHLRVGAEEEYKHLIELHNISYDII